MGDQVEPSTADHETDSSPTGSVTAPGAPPVVVQPNHPADNASAESDAPTPEDTSWITSIKPGDAARSGRGKIYEVTQIVDDGVSKSPYAVAISRYREEILYPEYRAGFLCANRQTFELVSSVWPKTNAVISMPHALLPGTNRLAIARMLASALCLAAQGEQNAAMEEVERAEKFLTDRNREWSRATFMLICIAIAAAFSLAIGVSLCWKGASPLVVFSAASWDWTQWPFLGYSRAAIAGAFGAVISVLLLDQRTSRVDPTSGWGMQFAEGFFRILAGSLGAVFVLLAVKADVVLSKQEPYSALVLLVCVIAGVSERLVPSIIKRVEILTKPSDAPDGLDAERREAAR